MDTEALIAALAESQPQTPGTGSLADLIGSTLATIQQFTTDLQVGGYFGAFPSDAYSAIVDVRRVLQGFHLVARWTPRQDAVEIEPLLQGFSEAIRQGSTTREQHWIDKARVSALDLRDRLSRYSLLAATILVAAKAAQTASRESEASTTATINEISQRQGQLLKAAEQDMEAARLRLRETTAELASAVNAEVTAGIERLRAEAEALLETLSVRGKETVARARKDLNDTILSSAQDQFTAATVQSHANLGIWITLTVGSLAIFFATSIVVLYQTTILPPNWSWQLLYHAGIRLIILGGLGGICSFCLRMLKRCITLHQLNNHRARVAASMPAFIEAAPIDEQFQLLRLLIESLITSSEITFTDANDENVAPISALAEKLAAVAKR